MTLMLFTNAADADAGGALIGTGTGLFRAISKDALAAKKNVGETLITDYQGGKNGTKRLQTTTSTARNHR
jgi:hypothetical protein